MRRRREKRKAGESVPTLPLEQALFQLRAGKASPASSLQRLNVRGLQALGAADNFELDRLAIVQALVSLRHDRGEVDENVLSGLALDETKALAGVKPLDCSLFFAHFIYSFR
jgi:hypothetical protein